MEIRFRGLSVDKDVYVYGSLIESKRRGHHFIIQDPYTNQQHYVHPDSVGIYTNLMDKKAREIFAGQTVKSDKGFIGTVAYEPQAGAFWIKWQVKNGDRIINKYSELSHGAMTGSEAGITLDNVEIID